MMENDEPEPSSSPWWAPVFRAVMASRVALGAVATVTVSGCLLALVIVAEFSGFEIDQYSALVAYTMLPACFVAGLLVLPGGILLGRRKAARQQAIGDPLVLDLRQPWLWRAAGFFTVATAVNIVLLASASYQGYHYTETVAFCGTLCHTVMRPEYTAYQGSPHSRVKCVECHIGSGASWFVKSKLSGLRQVVAVVTGDYHRPIPTPVHNLRPARDTCEQCHWPAKFHGTSIKAWRRYRDGALETPLVSAVMLKVGGRNPRTGKYSGIHWHVSDDNQVYYRTDDPTREVIPEVKVVRSSGKETLFRHLDLPSPPPETPWRRMDCIDCHNRPTHGFDTAEDAVDRAFFEGDLDRSLPNIRAAALEILGAEYPTNDAGREGVRKALHAYYLEHYPEVAATRKENIDRSAEALAAIYGRNVFPEMKVTWGTYRSNLGHKRAPGCFRCHDEEHESEDGVVIAQDCDLCHEILAEDETGVPPLLKTLEGT